MHSEIIILMDRTGSMWSIKEDMEGGFNVWIDEQKEVEGTASVTLLQFDSEGKDVVYSGLDLEDVPPLQIEPRNCTPLYDAIMWAIPIAEQRASENPDHIFFVIITDGLENASREATSGMVADKIKEMTDKAKWNFVFLGANQDAILSARDIGIKMGNALTYTADSFYCASVYTALSANMSATRGMASGSGWDAFTDDQRNQTVKKED
jgi:hypothetical protein